MGEFLKNSFLFSKNAIENEKFTQKEFEVKQKILSRFSMEQLYEIRRRYPFRFVTGPEILHPLKKPTKYDWVKYYANGLSLKEIIDEAERCGIEYKDLIEELEKFKIELYGENLKDKQVLKKIEELEKGFSSLGKVGMKTTHTSKEKEDRVLTELMKFLENELKLATSHITISNHHEVKKFLKIGLIKKYGKENVVAEKKRKDGKRPDLVIFGKYGIEIKLGDYKSEIERLPTQIELYRASGLKEVIGVIIEPESGDTSHISEVVKILKKRGMKYIIVKGKIKRTQRRVRTYKLIDEKPKRRKSSRSRRKK